MVNLETLLFALIAFLLSITVHEFFHAFTAYKLGDPTAKNAGRLTLNPIAHIDPLGLLFIIFFRIGWAKPVPVDPKNFKYPGLYSIIIGLAGPLSNFLLALLSLYGITYLVPYLQYQWLNVFLMQMLAINIMLGVFNILPIPPLDGGHIIGALVPERWKQSYARMQLVFLFLLFFLLSTSSFQKLFFTLVARVAALLRMLVY
jgi:Zn-dependent protease